MTSGRLLLHVGAEETSRYFRAFNKRVLGFILLVAAAGSLLGPSLLERGIVPDEDLYRADVFPGSPLLGPLLDDRRFDVHLGAGERYRVGEADLLIFGDQVFYRDDTERGRAALRDLSEHAERYYDRVLAAEDNQSAAFPVRVAVVYSGRGLTASDLAEAQRGPPPAEGGFARVNESLVLAQPGEAQTALVPGTVEPPFPMRSLLLTFVFLVPLNFIGQYYAGSLLQERTNQRGILLLSAPLTGPQILLGKSLPYLAASLLFALVGTLVLRAGLLAFLATLPIFLFFLAATSLAALLARSYRELTFFITTMSVALSTYLFLPAIFTQVHPVAFISPISVVAAGIRHETVGAMQFLYSITPLTLAGLVLAYLSTRLYREDTLFAPRRVGAKLLDALHRGIRDRRHFLYAGALTIPFVFGAELFVLAFAVSFPPETILLLFLVGVALVEEVAKALPSLAHYRRSRSRQPPLLAGALIGAGFFLGEKLSLLFSFVGLGLLPIGNALLSSHGVGTGALLILAPLGVHLVTAVITAYGARAGRAVFAASLVLAIALHAVYNAEVIRLLA